MSRAVLVGVALLLVASSPVQAQETPASLAAAYEQLADSILAVKRTEHALVGAILDGHRRHAEAQYGQGSFDAAAAEMALFASEGDNRVAGVRKRLLEGGHHHHADGEAQGVYEPGFVIVTKDAKKQVLDAAAALRRATSATERQAAWGTFQGVASSLLGPR
jgi:hypothetical protein